MTAAQGAGESRARRQHENSARAARVDPHCATMNVSSARLSMLAQRRGSPSWCMMHSCQNQLGPEADRNGDRGGTHTQRVARPLHAQRGGAGGEQQGAVQPAARPHRRSLVCSARACRPTPPPPPRATSFPSRHNRRAAALRTRKPPGAPQVSAAYGRRRHPAEGCRRRSSAAPTRRAPVGTASRPRRQPVSPTLLLTHVCRRSFTRRLVP